LELTTLRAGRKNGHKNGKSLGDAGAIIAGDLH
jgi:hypothetical protein